MIQELSQRQLSTLYHSFIQLMSDFTTVFKLTNSFSISSSHVMVSIAEFLIGHGSHGTVLLRYLRDLTLGKNEFLRKHKVCLMPMSVIILTSDGPLG